MRLIGHPLHPMLVHFPIAFWTLAIVCDGAAFFDVAKAWSLSCLLMALGLVMAVPAMIAGLPDFAKLKGHAVSDGTRHMMLMGIAWTLFLVSLLMRFKDGHFAENPEIAPAILSGAGFVLMAIGGWYGGTLVYRHGAGVENLHHESQS